MDALPLLVAQVYVQVSQITVQNFTEGLEAVEQFFTTRLARLPRGRRAAPPAASLPVTRCARRSHYF